VQGIKLNCCSHYSNPKLTDYFETVNALIALLLLEAFASFDFPWDESFIDKMIR
jgi:hypothetical protein